MLPLFHDCWRLTRFSRSASLIDRAMTRRKLKISLLFTFPATARTGVKYCTPQWNESNCMSRDSQGKLPEVTACLQFSLMLCLPPSMLSSIVMHSEMLRISNCRTTAHDMIKMDRTGCIYCLTYIKYKFTYLSIIPMKCNVNLQLLLYPHFFCQWLISAICTACSCIHYLFNAKIKAHYHYYYAHRVPLLRLHYVNKE